MIRLALNLSRFGAVALLLRWRAGGASDMTEESDSLLVSLLAGFGRTYYTRPSTELLGELRRAVDQLEADRGQELRRVLAEF